jgi:tRNA 2-thiouridine synthesizing protein A
MTEPVRIDVSHERCPMTWVRTRLALEPLASGARLEVLLGEGAMLTNVPRSAREAGHAVEGPEPLTAGRHLLTIHKRGTDR